MTPATTLFPNKVMFTGTRAEGFDMSFGNNPPASPKDLHLNLFMRQIFTQPHSSLCKVFNSYVHKFSPHRIYSSNYTDMSDFFLKKNRKRGYYEMIEDIEAFI